MKKTVLFLMSLISIVAIGRCQNFNIKRVQSYDLPKVESFFRDNLESLDPIEGIYRVSLKRKEYLHGLRTTYYDSFTYKCVIIKYGKGFYLRKIGRGGDEEVYDANVYRIGESNVYDIDLEYSNQKETASSRFEMNSLVRFQFSMQFTGNPLAPYTYNDDFDLVKEYPTSAMYKEAREQKEEKNAPRAWSGTGFALGNGYVVTNHHVIDGAKGISVKGIKGIMNSGYAAEVVASDKVNDIAILKIADYRFDGFGTIPYSVSTRMADVGEEVFVLGYPLTQALGNEIKLTNGIVSSRTGYQGDVSTYQMSAPVQPGNSGGPMFDSKGNIIGIVVAGVPGAENVGYAIKTSYLKILIESAGLNVKLPSKNSISALSLSEKVKRVKNMVLYIECGR